MSRFNSLIMPGLVDPLWGDFHNSLHSMERGMHEMNRLFGDMNNHFQQLNPSDHGHHHSGRRNLLDVGFPDAMIQNPVVTDRDGNRSLNYRFDVRQFKPEEISVKSFDDKRIEVSAKHEAKDDEHHVYREYRRVCTLPEGVDLKSMKSELHPDGVLCIQAPLPAIEAPKKEQIQARNEPIPMKIEHQGKAGGEAN